MNFYLFNNAINKIDRWLCTVVSIRNKFRGLFGRTECGRPWFHTSLKQTKSMFSARIGILLASASARGLSDVPKLSKIREKNFTSFGKPRSIRFDYNVTFYRIFFST